MTAARRRKSQLSQEDRALWREMTATVTPLEAKPSFSDKLGALPTAPNTPPEPLIAESDKAGVTNNRPRIAKPKAQLPPLSYPRAPAPPSYLKHGEAQGIDKRKLKRMQRGQLELQARLDLHGFTQSQAQAAVIEFLERCQAQGKRNVIIVTGKGLAKEGGGILRSRLPDWLNLSPNRERILSYDYSQPKDGGTGALYVVLRKLRAQPEAAARRFGPRR